MSTVIYTEHLVAAAFTDLLDVDRVGRDDNFLDLGGTSLLAMRLAARLAAARDTDLGIRDLFDHPTVAALAAHLDETTGGATRPALVAGPRPETVPLSPAQQRMWFINQFDTTSPAYNIAVALRLTGTLDLDALRTAVTDVMHRHEALRSRYPFVDETPRQVVVPAAAALPDFAAEPVPDPTEIPHRIERIVSAGFDVATEIPLRIRLLTLSDTEHVLVLVVHHISADGFSMGPLARDVMSAYT
ncbi:condensation domain-containing protein, partial [Rhodococcus chondri]